jgi:hypothetical protein
MDDVTIHIDELVLDGSTPPDPAALDAVLRAQMGSAVPHDLVDTATRAVTASVLAQGVEQ